MIPEEERVAAFGNSDFYSILDEIQNTHNRENFTKWIMNKIDDITAQLRIPIGQNKLAIKRILDNYEDNASKVLNNVVWKKYSPRRHINLNELRNYHSKQFSKTEDFEESFEDIFSLDRVMDECPNLLDVINEKFIKKIIRTRKKNSAAGPDGIPYVVFKEGGSHSVQFLADLFKSLINFKMIPPSWKESKTVLLFKKGEINDPHNWRPLSISNSIYRLFTCTISWTLKKQVLLIKHQV